MASSIVVGMFFGDEGKGTTVDYLAQKNSADLIVRYSGGAQAAHYVHSPDGKSRCFSQFGSSHKPIQTYLGPDMIIEPFSMCDEADHLKNFWDHAQPFNLLFVSRHCLITTPYHMQLGIIKEEIRGNKHGTCGYGIGETRKISREEPDLAIRVDDIITGSLTKKLKTIIDDHLMMFYDCATAETKMSVDKLIKSLNSFVCFYNAWARKVNVIDGPISGVGKNVIFESSQGLLLDESIGFHPYTTWSSVSAFAAHRLMRQMGIEPGDVEVVGVCRSHITRHGDGPLNHQMENELTDEDNRFNRYQKDFKVGCFDIGLLEYVMENHGFDRICLTRCDTPTMPQIAQNVYEFNKPRTIEDQIDNTYKYKNPKIISTRRLRDAAHLKEIISDVVSIPIIESHGKTINDKRE